MTKVVDIRNRTHGGASKRSLSQIKSIARHHSATTSGDYAAFWNHWGGKLKWNTGGYHEIILRDGTVQICYDPEVVTNGIYGHNTTTYHICLVGNGDFTEAQEKAWDDRVAFNMDRLKVSANNVKGHREYDGANTSCPGIDMAKVRARLTQTAKPTPPQTGGVQVDNSQPTLRKDARGDAVRVLQQRLLAHGQKLPRFGADGHFGAETLAAVRAFQRDKKLTVDGIVGPKTWAALNKSPQTATKEYVTLPASAKTWRTYRLNVAPVAANSDWSLTPSAFGGLTYEIIGRPQANVVTINTSRGNRNIFVGPSTSARIFKK